MSEISSYEQECSGLACHLDPSLYPSVRESGDALPLVTLPGWLYSLLFEDLGARFAPSRADRGFDKNLNSSHDEILTYLGTYFPRSFSEAFLIFDSLFCSSAYSTMLSACGRVRVLSVGTGTGGDLLGFLLALDHKIPSVKEIEIISIEGNSEAHGYAAKIFDVVQEVMAAGVTIEYIDYVFDSNNSFVRLADMLSSSPMFGDDYSFIITSKMLNELVDTGISDCPYYDFASCFMPHLSSCGVLLMLDVTSPVGISGKWVPKILNEQINNYLKTNPAYQTLLPLLCGELEGRCTGECYTQSRIAVSHSHVVRDISKSCYRLLGSRDLYKKIVSSVELWDCAITKSNESYCKIFNADY